MSLQASCTINVKLKPSASRERMVSVDENVVSVAVTQAPVDGKANEALVKFISRTLHVSRSSVCIRRGQASRNKVLEFSGMNKAEVLKKLNEAL
jgi:hypothetical protein